MRPTGWEVLDLGDDPTPGSPSGVRGLARRMGATGDDAADAERAVKSLAGDQAVLSWVGLAGDVFRGAIDEFPGQLGKLADSYHQAESALSSWASDLEGAQSDADRALVKGKAAKARLDSLQGQLSSAQGSLSSASSSYDRLHNPPPGGTAPDPAQVTSALRAQQSAQSRVSGLQSQVGDAQAELDLAKRLARDAADLRDGAADRAKSRIHNAADAGIKPNSFWEDFTSAVSKVWHVVVIVAKITVAVLGVVALIIGGPIAWVVFAAALVLLADALMKYANGEGSLWDVAFAALGCIPGTKGLTTLGELSMAFRAGGVLGAGAHVLGAGRTAIVEMATAIRNAPALVRSLPGDLAEALTVFGQARREAMSAVETTRLAVPQAVWAATPDGATILMMSSRTFELPSLTGSARATVGAAREALETYGSIRTAQIVGSSEDGYHLVMRYNSGWDDFQRASADAKATVLSDDVRQFSTTGPAGRDPGMTRDWASTHPIDYSNPQLDDFTERLFDPGHGYDVDHGVDLQFGGADDASNFSYLDSSVNRSEGAQVAGVARRYDIAHGTKFTHFEFRDRGFSARDLVRTGGYVVAGAH